MFLGKQAVGHLQAHGGIGIGFDQRVDIDILTIGLFLEQFVFTAQGFKGTSQTGRQTPVLDQGVTDKTIFHRADVQFTQHCPVLAVILTLVIPFVIKKGTLFMIGTLPYIFDTAFLDGFRVVDTVTGGIQVFFRNLAKILED